MADTVSLMLAKDEQIATLSARVARLEEAITAVVGNNAAMEEILFGDMPDDKTVNFTAPLGALRRLRKALSEKEARG